MLDKFLIPEIFYIQIFIDRFIVKNINNGQSIELSRPSGDFSPRMLISDFYVAHQQLKPAIKQLKKHHRQPYLLIHPMVILDGGMTPVEYRIFAELAASLGAAKIAVHYGEMIEEAYMPALIRELSTKLEQQFRR